VDLPPVSLYQSSYKYRSSYGSIYSSESGNEFYGLIVTVFDGDDQLIYQGVSVAGLKDSALAEKPEDNGSLKADYEAKELRYYALRDALNRDYDNEELSRAYSEARDAYYRARTAYEAVKHNYE